MAVYSTLQNRQLYVATGVATTLAGIKGTANLGKVYVGTDKEGNKYINQNGYGGIVRSDLIDPSTIMWANASGPKDSEIKLKAYTLKLDSSVNSGLPISGQDYIVRINFTQMYGMSDEDIYQKYGAVHATAAMNTASTVGNFYKELAYSLVKNFSRLYAPLIDIVINNKTIARATKIDGAIKFYEEDGTEITVTAGYNTGITLKEKSQVAEWALGTKQYTPVYFKVIPTTVFDADGNEVNWGVVTAVADANLETVGNGYKFADLEYFCMGERGDQYRNVGWPKVIPTKYFVDPTKTYYSLDIQYAYQGTCEDIQKSEKTMTIITDTKATLDSIITNLGIGAKVHYTDLYDGTANNNAVYPKTLDERVAELEKA